MSAFQNGELNTRNIFNPYSSFNIEIDSEDSCSWCGKIIPEDVMILGRDYLVAEALVFCSATCCQHYKEDAPFHVG